jgi:hypothetical protein
MSSCIINLFDRDDRLGSHLSWYISTILLAIKNNYKICLVKPKNEYNYYNSIFVKCLLNFIDDYNKIHSVHKVRLQLIFANVVVQNIFLFV